MGWVRQCNELLIMSLYIDDKALVSGTDRMLIMGARDCYQRLTALPPTWQKVRIGIIGSLTGLASSNGTPNGEILSTSLVGNRLFMGLSNGVGVVGAAGNRFVGAVFGTSTIYHHSNWNIGYDSGYDDNLFNPGAAVDNLGTFVAGTYTNMTGTYHNPTATSGCFFSWGVELDVSVGGTLSIKHYGLGLLSAADDAAMAGLLAAVYTAGTALTNAACFWSNGGTPTPVGCTTLYIRWPFSNNRLRIHNMGVLFVA